MTDRESAAEPHRGCGRIDYKVVTLRDIVSIDRQRLADFDITGHRHTVSNGSVGNTDTLDLVQSGLPVNGRSQVIQPERFSKHLVNACEVERLSIYRDRIR